MVTTLYGNMVMVTTLTGCSEERAYTVTTLPR